MKTDKSKIRDWLRQWDEGGFDFTRETIGEAHPPRPEAVVDDHSWIRESGTVARLETSVFRKLYPVFAVLLAAVMIGFFLFVVEQMPPFASSLSPANAGVVPERYLAQGRDETGAINAVAGVILDYRAFDTLGESHVLFTATMIVFILLLDDISFSGADSLSGTASSRIPFDNIPRNTAKVLMPFVLLFGIYVVLNGHLGPGGGFSGGTILGSAFILGDLGFGRDKTAKILNRKSFNVIVILSLLFYSFAKGYSFYCGANGLETIFRTGTPGAIFSAGLILPLDIAVGLVVGCTIYAYYAVFTRGRI